MVIEEYNHPCLISHGVRIDESQDDHELYLNFFKSENEFEREINSCGHNKNNYLPYYDSEKCCICDWKTVGSLL